MKYYKSKGRNMGLSVVVPSGPPATPFRDHVGGCCPDQIFQQQLPLKQTPKSKISNASSVAPSRSKIASDHAVDRLSEKNVKYIEDLKKFLVY